METYHQKSRWSFLKYLETEEIELLIWERSIFKKLFPTKIWIYSWA